jgi:TRAP-type C4-dicarboxylate transport system substrate-binding protein
MNNTLRTFTIATAAALSLSACGGAPSRTGQAAAPIELSSAGTGLAGVGGDILAKLVSITAGAAVSVAEPPEPSPGQDQDGDVLKALQSGSADVGVVRAGRLAMAGADSLAVLGTPFLIDTVGQAEKIAADPVAEDLMAGLDKIGLVGIALVPGGLRHPFGYGHRPLIGPADYLGVVINVRVDSGANALLAGLGATPDNSVDQERTDKVGSGQLRGIEVSLQQQGAVDRPAVVTSNVSLYTKFDVVVVRVEAWNSLSNAQRGELRAAAQRAGHDAIAERDTEEKALDRWCAGHGATSVIAAPDQVQALRDALAGVVSTLTATPAAKALAEQITSLREGTTPPVGKVCGTTGDDTTTTTTDVSVNTGTDAGETAIDPAVLDPADPYHVLPAGAQDVFQGVWRVEVGRQALLDAGLSISDANANAGVWTLTVTGNVAAVTQPHGPDCTFEFSFNGSYVSLDEGAQGNDSCYGHVVGTYRIDGNTLHLDWIKEKDYPLILDQVAFGELKKIG